MSVVVAPIMPGFSIRSLGEPGMRGRQQGRPRVAHAMAGRGASSPVVLDRHSAAVRQSLSELYDQC